MNSIIHGGHRSGWIHAFFCFCILRSLVHVLERWIGRRRGSCVLIVSFRDASFSIHSASPELGRIRTAHSSLCAPTAAPVQCGVCPARTLVTATTGPPILTPRLRCVLDMALSLWLALGPCSYTASTRSQRHFTVQLQRCAD